MEDLLKSNSSDGGSVWTALASIPTPQLSSLATLRGHVLCYWRDYVIWANQEEPFTAMMYIATNSWSVICEIPTPRSWVNATVLPSNELVVVVVVVVGGGGIWKFLSRTEISSILITYASGRCWEMSWLLVEERFICY